MTASASPRRKLFLGAVAVAAVIVAAVALPVRAALEAVGGLGAWGPLAFGALDVACCVLFVPGTIPTLAAGALFGVVVGTITVSLASTLGATLALLVGRYLARDFVARRLERRPDFAAIDR